VSAHTQPLRCFKLLSDTGPLLSAGGDGNVVSWDFSGVSLGGRGYPPRVSAPRHSSTQFTRFTQFTQFTQFTRFTAASVCLGRGCGHSVIV
jgi:hypothetical protein